MRVAAAVALAHPHVTHSGQRRRRLRLGRSCCTTPTPRHVLLLAWIMHGLILVRGLVALKSAMKLTSQNIGISSGFALRSREDAITDERAQALAIEPHGLMAVYKPKGWTSSSVVGKIRREIEKGLRQHSAARGESPPQGRRRRKMYKVGHGGTLDPMATGVLVLGVGSGTKLLGSCLSGAKMYSARGLLGCETDTQDAEGECAEFGSIDHVTCELLESSLDNFRGDILQIPPMYSALKKDGKRLYDLAREGKTVEREARPVTIYRLDLLSTNAELPSFDLSVHCSSGTYIRTLITDLARSVESRAHLTALERTQQGPFSLEHCLHEDDWNYAAICEHAERSTPIWQ
jgi:tRNA pseudouridine55 synthase